MTAAFAPGRANLIGEHTDYNDGLALPFAIEQGVSVRVAADAPPPDLDNPYVRGVVAEVGLPEGYGVAIESNLPAGAGLSSSAALVVALGMALGAEAGTRVSLAELGQRIEHEYAGAETGLLDQLAILLGRPGHAVRIDFREPSWRHVPLDLGDWRLATLDSGAKHSHAASGYNQRRDECREAAAALGLKSLRDAAEGDASALVEPRASRVRHVVRENARVDAAVAALDAGDLPALAALLDESHASLRDDYDVSVPEVEATVARAKRAGAAGARIMGGGFGGAVLALYPPEAEPPPDAVVLRPAAGARVVEG